MDGVEEGGMTILLKLLFFFLVLAIEIVFGTEESEHVSPFYQPHYSRLDNENKIPAYLWVCKQQQQPNSKLHHYHSWVEGKEDVISWHFQSHLNSDCKWISKVDSNSIILFLLFVVVGCSTTTTARDIYILYNDHHHHVLS